jgi:hypothetical protein
MREEEMEQIKANDEKKWGKINQMDKAIKRKASFLLFPEGGYECAQRTPKFSELPL